MNNSGLNSGYNNAIKYASDVKQGVSWANGEVPTWNSATGQFENAPASGGNTIYTADDSLTGDRIVDLDKNLLSFYLGSSTSRLVDKGFVIDASGIDHSAPNTLVFDVKGVSNSLFYLTHKGELISTSESTLLANIRDTANEKGLYLDTITSRFRGTGLYFQFENDNNQPYILNTNVSASSQMRWYKDSTTLEHTIKTSGNSEVIFFENGFSSAGFVIGSGSKIGTENISLQGSTLVKGTGSTTGTGLEVTNSLNQTSIKTLDDLTVILPNLPTSSAGLPSGAIWNNSGVINIV